MSQPFWWGTGIVMTQITEIQMRVILRNEDLISEMYCMDLSPLILDEARPVYIQPA